MNKMSLCYPLTPKLDHPQSNQKGHLIIIWKQFGNFSFHNSELIGNCGTFFITLLIIGVLLLLMVLLFQGLFSYVLLLVLHLVYFTRNISFIQILVMFQLLLMFVFSLCHVSRFVSICSITCFASCIFHQKHEQKPNNP